MKKKAAVLLIVALLLLQSAWGISKVFAGTVGVPSNFRATSYGKDITLQWEYSYNGSSPLYFQIYEYDYANHKWVYRGKKKYPTKKAVFTNQSYGKHGYKIKAKIDRTWPYSDLYSDYTSTDLAYVLHTPKNFKASISKVTAPVFKGNPYVTLRWDQVDGSATKIKVCRRIHGTNPWFPVLKTLPIYKTSYIDKTAKPNTQYDYWIYIIREDGNYSDASYNSDKPTILTYPEPPTDLTAKCVISKIKMSWKHSKNCKGYKIYVNKSSGMTYQWQFLINVDKDTLSYKIPAPPPGKYTYQVVAYNESGNSPTGSIATAYVLKKPVNLKATAISATKVKLTFDPVDSNAKNIILYESTNGTTYVSKDSVGANSTTITVTQLTPEKKYYFSISAERDGNISPLASPVSITMPPLQTKPDAPTDLAATTISSTEIDLEWSDNSDNEEHFVIERKEENGTYAVIATLDPDIVTYKDTGVSPDKKYYYRVKAINGAGDSDYSNEASATTPPLQTKPNAPTDLSAVSNSCSEVALTWTDNSNNEEHFIVERKEAGGTYTVIATLDPDTTTYTDSTVEENKTYYYRVKAVNGAGDSDYIESSAVNVPKCTSKPDAPTELSATTISSTEIDLVWSDNSDNEDGFKVERKELGGTYAVIATLPADTTSYKDKGLSYGTTYYYRVRAFNSKGFSDYSNEASATTESNPPPQTIITLQPDNPYMTVNGVKKEIDPGRGTKPVIIPKWGRTVVPIRAIVEALGGTISWNGKEREVTINFNDTVINLWIGNPKAEVNGVMKWIDPNNHDVKPIIVNSRTMLPLRFVAENLGCKVDWDPATKTITITYPTP